MSIRNEIIRSVIDRLTGIEGLPAPEFWRDMPAEFSQDWIGIRDSGQHAGDINTLDERILHLEVDLVIFGEDAPYRINDLTEVVESRLVAAIPQAKRIRVIEDEKLCQTGQQRSCQLCLKVDLTYRKERSRG